MKKLILGIALAATIALSAYAQQYCPASDFIVELVDGGGSVRIVEYIGQNQAVRIPSSINRLPVTHIGAFAFWEGGTLTDVVIPNSVTHIEEGAFFESGLSTVVIPDSVVYIGIGAFLFNRLTSVTIGSGVVSIGPEAFDGNPYLERIEIPFADIDEIPEDWLPGIPATAVIWNNENRLGRIIPNRLVVWSFTDEVEEMVFMHDAETALGMTIRLSRIPADIFPNELDPALAAGQSRAPDVFTLEAMFARRYIESGLLMDLTELYDEISDAALRYPVELASYNGRVYAISWQATPGAMFFRRSLALRYLGTDDPAAVQEYFANWNAFRETARRLNAASGGSVIVVPSAAELAFAFQGTRTQPWVVNGRLNIDPAMIEFMRTARYLRDNELEGGIAQWSAPWFAGMNGEVWDTRRGSLEVFAYFFPTWGLQYVLSVNARATFGDWAMIPGPAPWFWGGTWLAAYRDTAHPQAAKDLIRLLAMNEENLTRWATETGGFVSHTGVVENIVDGFSSSFLRGQNHYAIFAEIAAAINGGLAQGTDQIINGFFQEAVTMYANREATMEQALDWFRAAVEAELGLR